MKIPSTELRSLFIIVLISVAGTLGIDIYLPSMPEMVSYFHTSPTRMQHTITFFLVGMGLSLLFWGPCSDKFGRKPPVIFGLVLAIFADIMCICSDNITAFITFRLLHGIGCGACVGLTKVMLADLLHGDRLITTGSYIKFCVGVTPLISPILGAYVYHWFNWQANFILIAVLLLLSLILFFFSFPESDKSLNKNALKLSVLWKNYKFLLSDKLFMGSTMLTSISMMAIMAYASSSSFLFQIEYHLSVVAYGWVLFIASSGGLLGKFCIPVLVRYVGSKKAVSLGLNILLFSGIMLGGILLFKVATVALITAAIFLLLFGKSFVIASSFAWALEPFKEIRGAAGALYGCMYLLSGGIGSAVIACFTSHDVLALAIMYCILGVAGIYIYSSIRKKV